MAGDAPSNVNAATRSRPGERSTAPHFGPYAVTAIAAAGTLLCAAFHLADLSVVFTVLAVISLMMVDLRGILVLAFPTFTLVSTVWSVSLIEGGAFVTEQYRYGSNLGATPVLALYVIAFITTAHLILTLTFRKYQRTTSLPSQTAFSLVVAGGSSAIGAFYAGCFALYGLGLSHESRFDWISELPGIVQQLHGLFASFLIPAIFAVAGVALVVWPKSMRNLWLLSVLLPAVAILCTGEKFSGFQNMILMGLVGVGVGSYVTERRLRIRPLYASVLAGVSAAMAVVLFLGYSRMGVTDPTQSIRDRFALQGHVWFGIFDNFGGQARLGVAELVAQNSHDSPAGLDLLSYFVAPPDYVYGRIGRGVSFTMGGAPSALAGFGEIGGLFAFSVTSALYVAIVLLAVYSLARGSVVLTAVCFGIYGVLGFVAIMGRWDTIYGTVSITFTAFLLVGLASRPVLMRVMTRWMQRPR